MTPLSPRFMWIFKTVISVRCFVSARKANKTNIRHTKLAWWLVRKKRTACESSPKQFGFIVMAIGPPTRFFLRARTVRSLLSDGNGKTRWCSPCSSYSTAATTTAFACCCCSSWEILHLRRSSLQQCYNSPSDPSNLSCSCVPTSIGMELRLFAG